MGGILLKNHDVLGLLEPWCAQIPVVNAVRTLNIFKNHVEETYTLRIRPSAKLFSESFASPSTAASSFSPFSALSEGQCSKSLNDIE